MTVIAICQFIFCESNCGHAWFAAEYNDNASSWERRQQVPHWACACAGPAFLWLEGFFNLVKFWGILLVCYSSGKFLFMKNSSSTFIIMYFCILVWAPFYESYIRQISFIQFPMLFCVINKITSFLTCFYSYLIFAAI